MLAMIMQVLKQKGLQNKIEIYLDGGIRRGADVFKAIAIGAKAVFCGRPSLWGLAAGNGKDGVIKVFELMKREFINIMALSGCQNLNDINTDYIITSDNLPKF